MNAEIYKHTEKSTGISYSRYFTSLAAEQSDVDGHPGGGVSGLTLLPAVPVSEPGPAQSPGMLR